MLVEVCVYQCFCHVDVSDHDGAASLGRQADAVDDVLRLDVVDHDLDVVADQLLPEELARLEHVGDVVKGTEAGRTFRVLRQPAKGRNSPKILAT